MGIPWGRGLALNGLGWIALAIGDASQAERLRDGAMSEFHAAGRSTSLDELLKDIESVG